MWPNPQFPADLVTFTEEMLNEKLRFLWKESYWFRKILASHVVIIFTNIFIIVVNIFFSNLELNISEAIKWFDLYIKPMESPTIAWKALPSLYEIISLYEITVLW